MAVTVDNAYDSCLWGNPEALHGATAFTVAVTLTPVNTTLNYAIVGQWGGYNNNTSSWMLQDYATGILAIYACNGATLYYGGRTSAAVISAGVQARIVARVWGLGGTKGYDIWVNGVSVGLAAPEYTGAVAALPHTTSPYGIAGTGRWGQYSEIAVWNEQVPDWVCAAYGQGASPNIWRKGGVLYTPLVTVAALGDLWGGVAGQQGGSSVLTDAPHPRIYSVQGPHVGAVPAALPALTPLTWLGCYPDRLSPAARLEAAVLQACRLVPAHSPAEGSALDWTPNYPERVPRGAVHPTQVRDFQIPSPSICWPPAPDVQLAWLPQYVDRIARAPRVASSGIIAGRQREPGTHPTTLVAFGWDAIAGAETYQLEIGSETGLSNVYLAEIGFVLTASVDLPTGHVYYVRVTGLAGGVGIGTSPEGVVVI